MPLLAAVLAGGLVLFTAAAAPVERVFFISLDGLGQQLLTNDPAGKELTAVHKLLHAGSHADGLMPAFPSTTANSHAALWTGAYVGANGILYNRNLNLPRSTHSFVERGNGFRSEGLTAEPIWITAARQSVPVVAHQVTQAYPFLPQTIGDRALPGFTMVNGYQSRTFAPWQVLHKDNVQRASCSPWRRTLKSRARACFEWPISVAGGSEVMVHAAFTTSDVRIALNPGGTTVRVPLQGTEAMPPQKRQLARHWSAPLPIPGLPDNAPASLVFRLFSFDRNTGSFFLLQGPLQETAVFSESRSDTALATRLVTEAGPMAGNGAHALYAAGELGRPLNRGGNGTAELRYLETVEWVVRQQIAHSNWLFRTRKPRLHITYLPFPDEVDHTWYGLEKKGDTRFLPHRQWAYAAINKGAEALLKLASPRDHVVVSSDHGMAAVYQSVAVNVALQSAGLQTLDAKGQVDVAKSSAIMVNTCVLLNTVDWKGGIIKDDSKQSMLDRVDKALASIEDGGKPVVVKTYRAGHGLESFGHSGPAGADLCFDLAAGYSPLDALTGPVVAPAATPRGVHGFDPTRPDMHAILVVHGPRAPHGASLGTLRSSAVAPLLCDLLRIQPPRDSRERSPLSK